MNWLGLRTSEQLEAIQISSHNPDILGILIFKHSTRCAISSVAVNRLERDWNLSDDQLPTYFLDLLSLRQISDEIASMYGVQHESPQVLIVKDGKCVFSASHNLISMRGIRESLGLGNK